MNGEQVNRFWDIALKIAVPVILALCATVIYHEVRLTVIESNRFSSVNGLELERVMDAKYDVLKQTVNQIHEDVAVIRQIVERK